MLTENFTKYSAVMTEIQLALAIFNILRKLGVGEVDYYYTIIRGMFQT